VLIRIVCVIIISLSQHYKCHADWKFYDFAFATILIKVRANQIKSRPVSMLSFPQLMTSCPVIVMSCIHPGPATTNISFKISNNKPDILQSYAQTRAVETCTCRYHEHVNWTCRYQQFNSQ